MLPNVDIIAGGTPVRQLEIERAAEAAPAPQAQTNQGEQARKSQTGIHQIQDRVEINFSLSREERDAFVTAFSSKQDPAVMSEEEKATLRKASERISSFIDDAIARNTDNRERVEKAMKEWYSRITHGESPADLVDLLRKAAMGNLDGLSA